MNYLYIVNEDKSIFRGSIENSMPLVSPELIAETKVHYNDETFEQYNERKGGNLITINWDTFYEGYQKPYLMGLQKPFKEISKEHFYDMFECLPPERFTRFNDGFLFFISEAYTGNLHDCFVKKGDKYYSALRNIFSDISELWELKDATTTL